MIHTEDHVPVIFNNKINRQTTKKKHIQIDRVHTIENDNDNLKHDYIGINLGKQIQQARISSGYNTQKLFANALNVSGMIINDIESGRAIPDPKILQKIRTLTKVKFKTQ